MSALRHPNVLLTLGIAEDAATGSKGIVMELMEASLADVLNLKSFEQVKIQRLGQRHRSSRRPPDRLQGRPPDRHLISAVLLVERPLLIPRIPSESV